MTISVGEDNALWRPLDQDSNYTPGSRGCHRGHMEVLNVENAQPGFHYWYSRTDSSSLRRAMARGWEVCKLDSPERMGQEKSPDLVGTGLDTSLTRNDIVLCRMPESRYRKWREQLDQLSEGTGGDISPEFMERGRSLQEAMGEGKPLYFRGPGHGFRHIEHK